MASSVILISLDSSDESVDHPPLGVAARSSPPTHDLLPTDVISPEVCQILPAPPELPHLLAVLILTGQVIPLDQPYRIQPNGVRKMLTTRKKVRAFPLGRLASRYLSNHSSSDHFSLDGSSPNSSSDYSSGHSLPYSSFDAPTTIFARPSRKQCRSLTASVPLATPVPGALSPVRADLLLPRKRIRDIHVDTVAVETATALKVGIGIVADVEVKVGIEIKREDEVEKEAESRDRGSIEIGEELRQIRVSSYYNRADFRRLETFAMRHLGYHPWACSIDDNGDGNGNGNGDGGGYGNGNRLGRGNRNGNLNMNVRGLMPVAREYTYQDFLKCQLLIFKGNKGGLTRWFKKMETVFHIINCPQSPFIRVPPSQCTVLQSA
nr:hypothetical protein [Tanacetum cinerariifolium]